MGFRADIERVIANLPPTPERQTFLFSATVSPAIRQIARASLDKNHSFINTVSSEDSPVHAHIPQFATVLPSASEQVSHLANLIAHDQLSNPGKSKIIVFLNTTKMTQLVSNILIQLKSHLPVPTTRVYEIHSKKQQDARTRTSNAFREDNTGGVILVTSDVSARGVDYPGVTRVIQIGVPSSGEQYVHRVGRTGRGLASAIGRGDLVVLPFEQQFVSHELNSVPLQAVGVDEIQAEVSSMAESLAHNSPNAEALRRSRSLRGPRAFGADMVPRVEAIPTAAKKIVEEQSHEEIEGAFTAMLGFYAGRKDELRIRGSEIVDGCKEWISKGMDVSPPPLSQSFLTKIGLGQRGSPATSPRGGRERSFSHSKMGSSWGFGGRGRGESRSEENRSSRPKWQASGSSRPSRF